MNGQVSESTFLAGLHAQFSVPGDAVARLVIRATGQQLTNSERIIGGYDNGVYRVDLSNGRRVFVRIRRHGDGAFDSETWAMDLARDAGVPVPEVLLVSSVPDEQGKRPAMVMEPASGQVLAGLLASLSSSDRHAALADLGRVLGKLHSVAMPGVWRPDDDGQWPDPQDLRRGFTRYAAGGRFRSLPRRRDPRSHLLGLRPAREWPDRLGHVARWLPGR